MAGASARCEIKRKAGVAMLSTLAAARCRAAAGISERQLYWAVCALRQHLTAVNAQSGNSATNLSANYRIWRQILEDRMHQCVIQWHVHCQHRALSTCSTCLASHGAVRSHLGNDGHNTAVGAGHSNSAGHLCMVHENEDTTAPGAAGSGQTMGHTRGQHLSGDDGQAESTGHDLHRKDAKSSDADILGLHGRHETISSCNGCTLGTMERRGWA